MTRDHRPVLVAVAADGSSAALSHAVEEAARVGCPLQVMHVVDLLAEADGVLERAVHRARDLARGRVHVASALHHGNAVEGILATSARARLLVIQRRPRVPERQRLRGRLISGAQAPVLCVPEGRHAPLTAPTVTVGVHDTLTCGPLVDVAAEEARSRNARLHVLHVRDDADAGLERRELAQVLAVPGRVGGVVEVRVSVTTGRPAALLVAASSASDLLVLGRHHPFRPGGSQIGPVARRVLADSSCPVLLPTPSQSVSSAAWVFAGHLD